MHVINAPEDSLNRAEFSLLIAVYKTDLAEEILSRVINIIERKTIQTIGKKSNSS